MQNEASETLKQKLARALKQKTLLSQKSKMLEEELAQARIRELNSHEIVQQLLERQREMNVMLNRANVMLNRSQEANALFALEFNSLVQSLPAPKSREWNERVEKIQDLFKRSGAAELPEQLQEPDDDKIESLDAEFSTLENVDRKKALWQSAKQEQPQAQPQPEAKVEAHVDEQEYEEPVMVGQRGYSSRANEETEDFSDDLFPAKLRRWMQRIGRG